MFGNLVNRAFRFTERTFAGRVPEFGEPGERERALAAEIGERVARLREHHEALEFRRAAAETRAIWARANAYLQDAAPWTSFTSNPARAAAATRTALNLIRLSAVLAWSIIPDIAGRVLAAFGEQAEIPRWPTRRRSRTFCHANAPASDRADRLCWSTRSATITSRAWKHGSAEV